MPGRPPVMITDAHGGIGRHAGRNASSISLRARRRHRPERRVGVGHHRRRRHGAHTSPGPSRPPTLIAWAQTLEREGGQHGERPGALRIVSGEFRGKALVTPEGDTTRPTSDRARQAIFNILEHAAWSAGLRDAPGHRPVRRLGRPGLRGAVARGGLLPVRGDRRGGPRRDPRERRRHGPVRPHPGASAQRHRPGRAPRRRRAGLRPAPSWIRPTPRAWASRRWRGWPTAAGWRAGALVVFERGSDEPAIDAPGYETLDARDYGAARVHFLRYYHSRLRSGCRAGSRRLARPSRLIR